MGKKGQSTSKVHLSKERIKNHQKKDVTEPLLKLYEARHLGSHGEAVGRWVWTVNSAYLAPFSLLWPPSEQQVLFILADRRQLE